MQAWTEQIRLPSNSKHRPAQAKVAQYIQSTKPLSIHIVHKGNYALFVSMMMFSWKLGVRLVCVFKNWKSLFKNICENTCGWKSTLKCVKCCLKTENSCLKTQTKHPLRIFMFCGFDIKYVNKYLSTLYSFPETVFPRLQHGKLWIFG